MLSYYENITSKASEVFYKEGFLNVSVERIIEYSGISRRTFYKYFCNKNDIVCSALKYRSDLFCREIYTAISQCASSHDVVCAIFETLIEWHRKQGFNGCLFQSAISQYGNNFSKIHEISAAHKEALNYVLVDAFTGVGSLQAERLANSVMLLMEGATALGNFGAPIDQIKNAQSIAIQLTAVKSEGEK